MTKKFWLVQGSTVFTWAQEDPHAPCRRLRWWLMRKLWAVCSYEEHSEIWNSSMVHPFSSNAWNQFTSWYWGIPQYQWVYDTSVVFVRIICRYWKIAQYLGSYKVLPFWGTGQFPRTWWWSPAGEQIGWLWTMIWLPQNIQLSYWCRWHLSIIWLKQPIYSYFCPLPMKISVRLAAGMPNSYTVTSPTSFSAHNNLTWHVSNFPNFFIWVYCDSDLSAPKKNSKFWPFKKIDFQEFADIKHSDFCTDFLNFIRIINFVFE